MIGMVNAEVVQAWPGPLKAPAAEADHAGSPDYARARKAARGEMEAFEEIYRLQHRRSTL